MHKNNTYSHSLLLVTLLATITLIALPINTAKAETQYNARASFAGGCFWCSEYSFEITTGVTEAISGYTGGNVENPTYAQVCTGTTGHYEAVMVYYNSEIITYKELLNVYWRHIDPTDPDGQFADRGTQYRTAIFYHDEDQKRIAEESKKELNDSGKFSKPIATQILPFTTFYPAEDYHQDYYKKQQARFNTYEQLSGREQFIEQTWGTFEPSQNGSIWTDFNNTPTRPATPKPTGTITSTPAPISTPTPAPNQNTQTASPTSVPNTAGNLQLEAFYILAGASVGITTIAVIALVLLRNQKLQTKNLSTRLTKDKKT